MKQRREEWRAKGEKYHQQHLAQQKSLVDEKRKARNAGNFYVPPEATVAFVIRLKG